MYKVFFNDRIIKVVSENNLQNEGASVQSVDEDLMNNMESIINDFFKSHNNELILKAADPKKVWKKFKRYFKVIKAAGGIVKKENTYLLIFRLGKWDLPKGKINKGESTKNAALREVQEECGVSELTISKKLQNTWHIYKGEFGKSKGKWILKKTSWYEMDYIGNESLVPELEEDITEVIWADKNECDKLLMNSFASIQELWTNYL